MIIKTLKKINCGFIPVRNNILVKLWLASKNSLIEFIPIKSFNNAEFKINMIRLIKNIIVTKKYLKNDTNSILTLYFLISTFSRKGRIMIKNGFNRIEQEMKKLPIMLFFIDLLPSFLKK